MEPEPLKRREVLLLGVRILVVTFGVLSITVILTIPVLDTIAKESLV